MEKAKIQLDNNENQKARNTIDNVVVSIKDETNKLKTTATEIKVFPRNIIKKELFFRGSFFII